MRVISLTLLIPLFLACGQTQVNTSDDPNNPNTPSGGFVQIKTVTGQFESIPKEDLLSIRVKVIDQASQTAYEKTFSSAAQIGERLKEMGLQSPGKKTITNLPMTGEVIVNYYSEDMLSANFRVFNIYGAKYLQDTVFNDVIYTTEKSITLQWLK